MYYLFKSGTSYGKNSAIFGQCSWWSGHSVCRCQRAVKAREEYKGAVSCCAAFMIQGDLNYVGWASHLVCMCSHISPHQRFSLRFSLRNYYIFDYRWRCNLKTFTCNNLYFRTDLVLRIHTHVTSAY